MKVSSNNRGAAFRGRDHLRERIRDLERSELDTAPSVSDGLYESLFPMLLRELASRNANANEPLLDGQNNLMLAEEKSAAGLAANSAGHRVYQKVRLASKSTLLLDRAIRNRLS